MSNRAGMPEPRPMEWGRWRYEPETGMLVHPCAKFRVEELYDDNFTEAVVTLSRAVDAEVSDFLIAWDDLVGLPGGSVDDRDVVDQLADNGYRLGETALFRIGREELEWLDWDYGVSLVIDAAAVQALREALDAGDTIRSWVLGRVKAAGFSELFAALDAERQDLEPEGRQADAEAEDAAQRQLKLHHDSLKGLADR